jgi:ABC-type transport system involved in cytochrome c biogenesis permease subunit
VNSKSLPHALLTAAFVSYILYIALRFFQSGSFPVGDFHGTAALIGNFLAGTFTLMLLFLRRRIEDFGFAIAFVGFLTTLLGLPSTKEGFSDPLFILHILSAAGSYAFIILGGISSGLRLFIERKLKVKTVSSLSLPLRLLKKMERLSVNLSFIFLTLTLIFGSLWTRDFMGKHWINDPKLIFTLLLWFYYAIMVHLNIVKGIRPSRFSYMSITGLLIAMGGILWIRHSAL